MSLLCLLQLLSAIGLLSPLVTVTDACTNDSDCSLLGLCNSATHLCECVSGFYGTHCNYLNLTLPIDLNRDGYHNTSISSWDGWPIADTNDRYQSHLFISVITNHCSLQGHWRTNSIIAHLISVQNQTIGPYTLSDIALYPNPNQSSFDSLSVYNPSVIKKDDLYLLYYTATTASLNNGTHANCTAYASDDLGNTQKIGLATSKSLYGPWLRSKANPIIAPNRANPYLYNSGFVCNQAPLLLRNKSIAIVYKSKPLKPGNSTMYYGIALANDAVNGPYSTVNMNESLNLPNYCADPFLWSSNNETRFHLLLQCHWNCSQQIAFSHDLLQWDYFEDKYWCHVQTTDDDSSVQLLRRERPALMFSHDSNGTKVEYLFTAVQPQTGRTFNSAQKIGHNS